jgi:hypothetical protein
VKVGTLPKRRAKKDKEHFGRIKRSNRFRKRDKVSSAV